MPSPYGLEDVIFVEVYVKEDALRTMMFHIVHIFRTVVAAASVTKELKRTSDATVTITIEIHHLLASASRDFGRMLRLAMPDLPYHGFGREAKETFRLFIGGSGRPILVGRPTAPFRLRH